MNHNILEQISQLRLSVGYLMEEKKWWHSHFFEPTSTDFLAYIFPKSIKQNSDFYLEAIRYSVDAEVGANYYHLFRLPIHVEENLYKKASIGAQEIVSNKENAIEILRKLTEDLSVEQNQGPINVGSSEHLNEDLIQAIAAHYLSSFENNYKVHPYLL